MLLPPPHSPPLFNEDAPIRRDHPQWRTHADPLVLDLHCSTLLMCWRSTPRTGPPHSTRPRATDRPPRDAAAPTLDQCRAIETADTWARRSFRVSCASRTPYNGRRAV